MGSLGGVTVAPVLLATTLLVAGCGSSTPEPPATVTVTQSPTDEPSAPPPPTWQEVVAGVSGSVVQLKTSSCDEGFLGTGSGFVVGPDLIVTAAHVVDGADAVTGSFPDGSSRELALLGADSGHDTAVLRSTSRLPVTPLELAAEAPAQGSDLAAVGYPLSALTPQLTTGIVSGDSEAISYDSGQVVDPVFRTDALTNPGNSGGPVLALDSRVIGLVTGGYAGYAGVNFVVPAPTVASVVADYRGRGAEVVPPCGDAPGDVDRDDDRFELTMTVEPDDEQAQSLAGMLFLHGTSINRGQYEAAWNQFTTDQQDRLGPFEAWRDGVDNSFWNELEILSYRLDKELAHLEANLRTSDFGDGGDPCTRWHLDYQFEAVEDGWLIEKAKLLDPKQAC